MMIALVHRLPGRMRVLTGVLIVASSIVAGGSGCAGSAQQLTTGSSPGDVQNISYSLYLNRASLSSQEFEQYKALPQGIFMECGIVHRGRSQVKEQGIESLSEERQTALKVAALEIFSQLVAQQGEQHVDSPGTGAGFTDPGKFTLVIARGSDKAEVRTSLDWVERKLTAFAKKLNSFTEEVRGVASKAPCGNGDFYGIGRVPQ